MNSNGNSKKLGDLTIKIGSGATPRGGKDTYKNNGIALIRSQNVYNEGFNYQGLAFIDEEQAKQLNNVIVEPEDVLLNITGDSVARVCQVPIDVLPARVNQHVTIIRSKKGKLDARFLHYFLSSPQMQDYMSQLASAGATRNALTKGMIGDFNIPDLDLEEQERIGEILGSFDNKNELNRRMNQTLEEMARAIYKSWFIDFDPVRAKVEGSGTGLPAEIADLFPDSFEETLIGEIPKGWNMNKLFDVCEFIFSGGTPSTTNPRYWEGEIPWLSSGETGKKFIITTDQRISNLGVENSSTRLARSGSTVIASAGQGKTRGQASLLLIDTYINQSILALFANDLKLSDFYLFFNLSNRYDEFRQISDSNSSRGSLTTKIIGNAPIITPPREIITQFNKIVRPMVNRIEQNLKQSDILTQMRNLLLPRLMAG